MSFSRVTAALAIAALPVVLAGTPPPVATGPPPAPPAATVSVPGCEPEAPLVASVDAGPVRAGRSAIAYRLSPAVATFDLAVALEPLAGARVLRHRPPDAGPRAAGDAAKGSALVAVTDACGVDLTFVATIADPAGADGRAQVSVTRRVTFGVLPLESDARPVRSGGEVLAEVPALWRPAEGWGR